MRYFACFLFLFAFSLSSKAQVGVDETVVPKSPVATGFDQLDVVPVDLSTGGANVSFNLYNINTKSTKIPIDLRYHSGGIKVDEVASWVGLGWTLDVGGLISRKINGNPDEGLYFNKEKRYYVQIPPGKPGAGGVYGNYDTSAATKSSCQYTYGTPCIVTYEIDNPQYKLASQSLLWGGYYVDAGSYKASSLSVQQLYSDVQSTDANPNSTSMPTNDNIYTSNLVDPQPDEFNLRLPGYSGSFLFNNLGVPQLNPVDKDLKISLIYSRNESDGDIEPSINSWVVSTTTGLQYYFGSGSNAITHANGGVGSRVGANYSPITEWYLTKIVDVNSKDSIIFTYKQGTESGKSSGMNYNPFSEFDEEVYLYTSCTSFTANALSPSNHVTTYNSNQQVAILSNITTSKESINFYSSLSPTQAGGEPPKLDSITITDKSTGTTVNKYNFNYGSYNMNNKLKLTSFQKQSFDQVNMQPPTSFNYYDTTVVPKLFQNINYPGQYDTVQYAERAQDYWGYYNNALQNYLSNLVYPSACSKPGFRKPVWPFAQLDVLNKITYPAGGQTILEYEPNNASYFYSPGTSQINQETYDIYNDFSLDTLGGVRIKRIKQIDSAGKTNIIRQYSYANGFLNITPSVTQIISELICSNDPFGSQYIMLSNENRTPLHTNGAIVNYGSVTETILDSLGNSNGYTISTFYNDVNTPNNFLSSYCSDTTSSFGCPANNSLNGLGNMPAWLSHHSAGKNLLNGYEIDKQVFTKDNKLLQKHTNTYSVKQYWGIFQAFSFMGRHSGPCNVQWSPYDPGVPPAQYYYYLDYYMEFPKNVFLSTTRDVSYTTLGDSIVNVEQLYHESPNHLNTTRSVSYNSKGDTLSSVNIYAFDLANSISGDTTAKQMQGLYFNPLINSTTFKGSQIRSSKVTIYKNFGTAGIPAIYPGSVYIHRLNSLATPLNTYGTNNVVTYPVTTYFPDNNYTLQETYNFAANGNLLERTKVNDVTTAYVWDYNSNLPIAEASKAKVADIAYTSFEADGNGGWTISSTIRDSVSAAVTGRKSYMLSNGNITKTGLTSSRNYRVSYWTKNASAYTITGTQAGYPVQGKTINGWTYFEHKVTGQSTITISGSNSIDELRLYPDTSQMSTLTYNPMVGMTSQCDVNNRVTYYEYDGLQRLSIIRDQDRNAVKKICYNYAGQPGACTNNLYYNLSVSQSFTRNSCGKGYSGDSVIYTVPFGKYTASTASGANQLAQNDINSNGQAYANANGVCLLMYFNVVKSGTYTRNNCGTGSTGSQVTYTVAANTYSSLISQADADQQAQNDVNANGQSYANANGTCSGNVTITGTNYAGVTGFTAVFTNTVSGVKYTFTMPAAGGTLGTIPSGNYNVTLSKTGNITQYYLAVCSNATDGATSVTFNNMVISSTCSTVTIDFIE